MRLHILYNQCAVVARCTGQRRLRCTSEKGIRCRYRAHIRVGPAHAGAGETGLAACAIFSPRQRLRGVVPPNRIRLSSGQKTKRGSDPESMNCSIRFGSPFRFHAATAGRGSPKNVGAARQLSPHRSIRKRAHQDLCFSILSGIASFAFLVSTTATYSSTKPRVPHETG